MAAVIPSSQETATVIPLAGAAAIMPLAKETAACGETHKVCIAVIDESSDGTEPENVELNIILTTNEKQHQHTQINRSPQ